MANRKLGRTSSHRAAMFRNQLASLIDKERIITTLPKAKEIKPLFEKLITLARTDTVHARRLANRQVQNDDLIKKLFDTLGPRFSTRPGGYTRIMKLGARRGDAAEMAILELVERSPETDATETEAPAKASTKKKAAPAAADTAAGEKPKRGAKKAAAPKSDAPAAEDKPKRPRKKKEE
jgi:large subunit ribosomal protein L17